MIDPRISLLARVPDLGQTFTNIQNRLNNRETQQQNTQLFDMKMEQGQQQMQDDRDNRRLQSVAEFSSTQVLPNINNPQLLASKLQQRIVMMDNDPNMDSTESREALAQLQSGDIQGLQRDAQAAVQLFNMRNGGQQKVSEKFFAPQTDQLTGQQYVTKVNPNTGVGERIDIPGSIQPTNAQTLQSEAESAKVAANLEIDTKKTIATNNARVARTSTMKKDYSESRRLAARSNRRVIEAQKLVSQASQGLGGVAKLQLSRVFPNIDASDEGALGSAFKSLSLDELQKFKGPTTDFEFAVTQDIAGSLGQGAFANQARLASLQRNNWFVNRESEQFDKHIKDGHDPDRFAFNINEIVTPLKGGTSYPLADIQDTAVANHISIEEAIIKLANANRIKNANN
jgi:hypothetical protein